MFVKAGAILPRMFVDDGTMNILGKRTDRNTHTELIARIYPGPTSQQSAFTLYEDDGVTSAYRKSGYAQTKLSQQHIGNPVNVTIGPTSGNTAMKIRIPGQKSLPRPADRIGSSLSPRHRSRMPRSFSMAFGLRK